MWKRFSKRFSRLLSRILYAESCDTYQNLELRRPQNLDNLEEMKKLRIKNFQAYNSVSNEIYFKEGFIWKEIVNTQGLMQKAANKLLLAL